MRRYLSGVVAVLVLLTLLAAGCSPTAPGTAAVVSSQSPAQSVRASGHLRLPSQQWLYFEKAGTVKNVLVKKGDRVTRGQLVAQLDDTDAQAAVKQAENSLLLQELALKQAERSAQTAQLDLVFNRQRLEESFPPTGDTVYNFYTDVPALRSDVAQSQDLVKTAQEAISAGKATEAAASLKVAGDLLAAAYNASLATQFIAVGKTTTLSQSIASLRQLEYNIERSQAAAENAGLAVEQARASVTAARLALENARRELTRATLVAPFDGLASDVPARAGDRLGAATYTTSPVLRLVDPAVLEMEGFLDELDRPRVVTGSSVSVTLDALPGTKLEGELTFISPVARVEAGVVSYAFTVKLRQPYPAGAAEGMSATAVFTPSK